MNVNQYVARYRDEEGFSPKAATQPIQNAPGSAAKIQDLIARVERGEELFSDADRQDHDGLIGTDRPYRATGALLPGDSRAKEQGCEVVCLCGLDWQGRQRYSGFGQCGVVGTGGKGGIDRSCRTTTNHRGPGVNRPNQTSS